MSHCVNMKHILILTSLCSFLVGYVAAETRWCYGCTNSTSCNSPINKTAIDVGIMECEIFERNIHNFVCTTVEFTYRKNEFMTIRGCLNISEETCSDVTKIINKTYENAADISCQTCTTDLCNNSESWNILTLYLVLAIGVIIAKF
ncbi:uncharacterized protein [Euwallacea similis]|uniref:uncharacterized protein n=1 Tax=Euwallacea similis TaxID=1736056 RepID=UPI0034507FE4